MCFNRLGTKQNESGLKHQSLATLESFFKDLITIYLSTQLKSDSHVLMAIYYPNTINSHLKIGCNSGMIRELHMITMVCYSHCKSCSTGSDVRIAFVPQYFYVHFPDPTMIQIYNYYRPVPLSNSKKINPSMADKFFTLFAKG